MQHKVSDSDYMLLYHDEQVSPVQHKLSDNIYQLYGILLYTSCLYYWP